MDEEKEWNMGIGRALVLLFLAFCTSNGTTDERTKRSVIPIHGPSMADMVRNAINVAVVELQHKKVLEEQMYRQGTYEVP